MMTDTLELFLAIARGMTFFDVAEESNLSQSALSKKIKKLEEEFGVELFDRTERSAKLTSAGKVLFKDLEQLEPGFKALKHHMKMISSNHKISCLITIPGGCLRIRNLLDFFITTHSDIFFTTHEINRDRRRSAFEALKRNEFDFVIMHEPLIPKDFYDFTILHEDYPVVILPKTHPQAGKSSICYEDLNKETIILNPWTKELAVELEEFTGIKLTNILETSKTREDIAWFVTADRGIGLFYASDINTINLDSVSVLRIKDIPEQAIILAYRHGLEMTPERLQLEKYLTDETKNKQMDLIDK